MNITLEDARRFLARTPQILRAMTSHLSDAWLDVNEGPDTFSPRDVLGHLISGEEHDWIPRMKTILEHGESRAFTPFDRFEFRVRYGSWSVDQLLDRFEEARRGSLLQFDQLGITPADFTRTGTHPKFGRVTFGQLLSTWVAHDFTHISQITRVIGKQYREAVGPWQEFLRVVRD